MIAKKYLKIILAVILLTELLILSCLIAERIKYPKKYSALVKEYSCEYGVPEYIVYSVIKVESNFDINAVSPKGACGLMQLMPDTYAWLCEISQAEKGDISDPRENIRYGVCLLSILYKRYGSWDIAYCAYNAGMGNVDKWLKDGQLDIKFKETENYLKRIKAAERVYKRLCREGGNNG